MDMKSLSDTFKNRRLKKENNGLRQELSRLKRDFNNLLADTGRKKLLEEARYRDPLRLNSHEYQVYSQNGEDGVLDEVFRRIGTTNRFFVEFGAADGLKNNTTNLLVKAWSGVWLEANPKHVDSIHEKFGALIEKKKLCAKEAKVLPENVESVFRQTGVPEEFDLLSIDIDGNDYWVWKAISDFKPRVVVIEYNAVFYPDQKWVMQYNPGHRWPRTRYFGASLKSLELLGQEKGYHLVGCDLCGANAFFVREDLCQGKFHEPFTAENHYEPSRYYLAQESGHVRDFGAFEEI